VSVARFFVYALLGADHDRSPYTQTGERIARLAAHGVRLVIEELRSDVTRTRKDGSRGRLKFDYGDPQAAIRWLWKFILCRVAGYAESACGRQRLAWSAGGRRSAARHNHRPWREARGWLAVGSLRARVGRRGAGERAFLEGEVDVTVDSG